MDKKIDTSKLYTAVFPKMDQAVKFEARLLEGRDWAVNVARKGRTVTFNVEIPAEYIDSPVLDTFGDKIDLVGYFGSSQSRKATLNGVPAPISY